jgi:hypothetical protein
MDEDRGRSKPRATHGCGTQCLHNLVDGDIMRMNLPLSFFVYMRV